MKYDNKHLGLTLCEAMRLQERDGRTRYVSRKADGYFIGLHVPSLCDYYVADVGGKTTLHRRNPGPCLDVWGI